MQKAARALQMILLGGFLGAALIVAKVVAPHAFETFATRAQAGDFVGHVLRVLDAWAIAAGIAGVGGVFVRDLRRARNVRLVLPAIVAACGVASLVLDAKIRAMREALGPIDLLSPDDPRRHAFGMWHGVSMLTLLVAMIAAAAALILDAIYVAEAVASPPTSSMQSSG